MRKPVSGMFDPKIRSDIAIRTWHQRFVTALAHESGWLLAGLSPRILGWENFTLLRLGDDAIALKTAHGNYVTALTAHDRWSLRGGADRILGWEIFRLQPTQSDPGPRRSEYEFQAYLRTAHGRFVRACEGGDGFRLRGDCPEPRSECTFTFLLL